MVIAFALVLLYVAVIGCQNSRHFFNQWEAKPKLIVTCTHVFSRALRRSRAIASKSDWLIALFVSAVIGESNCFGFGFTTLNWKALQIPVSDLPIVHIYQKLLQMLCKKAAIIWTW